jgi:YaiO family outer membrane protein
MCGFIGWFFALGYLVCSVASFGEGNTIEGGGIYADLSDGYSSTYGEYLRARVVASTSDAFALDITNLDRFDDDGTQITVGNTHQFGDRVYTQLSVAGSSGGFFSPRMRVDAAVSFKWLPKK